MLSGIRELVEKHGGQLPAYEATGIRQQTMSKYLSGEGKPGLAFAERLALALGKPRDAFRDHYTERPDATVVRPSRYPNYDAAAVFARATGISEEAIEGAFALLKSEMDLSAERWLEEMKVEQRSLDRARKFPVEHQRAEAARLADAAQKNAQVRADVARGDTADQPWKDMKAGKLPLEPEPEAPVRKTGLKGPGKKK